MKTADEAMRTEENNCYPEFDLTCSYETPGREDAILIHPPGAEPGDEEWIAVDEAYSVPMERTR